MGWVDDDERTIDDATADRISIGRSRAQASTGPLHGARVTWPHGGAPAPTAPPCVEAGGDGRVRVQDRAGSCSELWGGSWLDHPICGAVATTTPLF
jgi:hypothetical protein